MTDQNAPAKGRREVRRGGRAARKAARAAAVVEAEPPDCAAFLSAGVCP